jgi:hypothetical protein
MNIPVRCNYKDPDKRQFLQTFRGAAAGLIESAE